MQANEIKCINCCTIIVPHMPSVKVLLKLNKQKPNGEYPLYIRITKDRRSKFISLGIYIQKKYWNENDSKLKSSHPNSARLNNLIAKNVKEAEALALLTLNALLKHSIITHSIDLLNLEKSNSKLCLIFYLILNYANEHASNICLKLLRNQEFLVYFLSIDIYNYNI